MKARIECTKMMPGIILSTTFLLFALLTGGCSKSNNLLLGRVESRMGTHTVMITDCYRTNVPSPERTVDSTDGSFIFHFKPCLDAEVIIHNEQLFANGVRYEKLAPGDTVVIDHGQVLINTHVARRAPASSLPPSSR
jgi:hypothetical protein